MRFSLISLALLSAAALAAPVQEIDKDIKSSRDEDPIIGGLAPILRRHMPVVAKPATPKPLEKPPTVRLDESTPPKNPNEVSPGRGSEKPDSKAPVRLEPNNAICKVGKRGLLSKRCWGSRDNVPTVNRILSEISLPRDRVLFYSGPPSRSGRSYAQQVTEFNQYNGGAYTTWGDMWQSAGAQQLRAQYGQGDRLFDETFVERSSEAMARGASGTVYVALPHDFGVNWHRGTIWDTIEYPTLARNPAVTQLIRIDPRTGQSSVVFRR